MAGDEIVQLYVSYPGSRVEPRRARPEGVRPRPPRAGRDADACRSRCARADLAYWDVGAGAWVVEPITYEVHVGPSSRDLPLQGAFTIAP